MRRPRRPGLAGTRPFDLALLAVVAAAVLALTPSRAWAANGLTAADPADGAALRAAPDAVVLTFSAVPDPTQSHVSTRDGVGREVGTDSLTREGRSGLRLAVSIRAAGDYTTAYHVVFGDGTDVIGVLRFSVGTGVAPRVLGVDAVRKAQQTVASGHDHGVDPLSGGLLVVDLVVFVGVVLLLLHRPLPRPRFDDDSRPRPPGPGADCIDNGLDQGRALGRG